MSDDAARAAFITAQATVGRAPLVPEIALYLASEPTALWHATEAWLDERGVPPPFWAFAWAGGQALARYLLDHPWEARGATVVDFASGGGIVAIAAALCGARRVVACDVDAFAVTACAINAEMNGVHVGALKRDVVGEALDADVVTAGDVFYEREASARFLPWLAACAARGARVLAGDPERAYAPAAGAARIATYEVATPEALEGRPLRRAHVLAIHAAEATEPAR